MAQQLTAKTALDRYFLETRCKIIEIAANLDRIDRGDGAAAAVQDPRMVQIREAVQTLLGDGPGRAEKCQLVFSIPYDDGWSPPNSK
ncbi:MAG: hypothetical protein MI923_01365 [Phycisphaerales bacterium]|nr:hypothetical protein [Phycisphaerales bacterium]